MRKDISRTFDKSDGLFQPVSVLIAVVEDVGADGEAGRLFQQRIDFIDGVEHRLQGLDDAKRENNTHMMSFDRAGYVLPIGIYTPGCRPGA